MQYIYSQYHFLFHDPLALTANRKKIAGLCVQRINSSAGYEYNGFSPRSVPPPPAAVRCPRRFNGVALPRLKDPT